MIYSVLRRGMVPVTVDKKTQYVGYGVDDMITRYSVYDSSEPVEYVGHLDLQDTKNGVKVLYIQNENPEKYKHFADVADQIEVEHCLKRNINNPYISSVAARDTYAMHYRRGKRFINEGANVYLESITKDLKKGERVTTDFLGYQKMYMPINMLNKMKEKIKLNPLLKDIK